MWRHTKLVWLCECFQAGLKIEDRWSNATKVRVTNRCNTCRTYCNPAAAFHPFSLSLYTQTSIQKLYFTRVPRSSHTNRSQYSSVINNSQHQNDRGGLLIPPHPPCPHIVCKSVNRWLNLCLEIFSLDLVLIVFLQFWEIRFYIMELTHICISNSKI